MRGCSSINYRNTRTRWRFIHAWRGSIRSRKSVRGGVAWAGRTVGGMDAAIEPPWVRALCLRSIASQAPERTAASGWAGPRSGVYGVSCLSMPPRQPTECQLLPLLLLLGCRPAAGTTRGQGAALPKNTHKKTAGRGLLFRCNGAPGEIRTPDRLVRSQVLYPTELRARGTQSNFTAFPAADAGNLSSGAPGEIRTPDRLVRSQVLYPTELRAPIT